MSGSLERRPLHVTTLADGSRLDVPIIVFSGTTEHPHVVCVAGIHGDEPEGMRALMELADEIDPASLRGRLVLIPVANPPAFAAASRVNPMDGLDLNRIFPGRADGSVSERLAHTLFEQILCGADFVFAIHSWNASGEVLPYVEYGHAIRATAEASLAAGRAAGFELIRVSRWPHGLMTRVVNEAGIAAMESEIGGLGMTTSQGTERTKLSIRGVMAHLGMVDGQAAPWRGRIVDQFEMFAPCGGFLTIVPPLGAELSAGDTLGYVRSLNGAVVEKIEVPRRGMLAAMRRAARVQPGERIARIFFDYIGEEIG